MYARVADDAPIVQKYGGTSVGSVERIDAVAERVARLARQGKRWLAVVVSAMAGETNRLVDLVNAVNPEASGPAYDLAVAAGEQVSVALLTAALEKKGLRGAPLLAYQLGIYTDEFHSKARIRSIDTQAIERAWSQGQIPVIAGFQGVTRDLRITTLGRGGSDTSAVALAVALKAGFCEINTDVDGVYTADPRIVADARLIKMLDYEVALEMASLGSKVLHPRCVELGAKYKMPLTVRNSFKPDDHERTVIMSNVSAEAATSLEALVVSGVTTDRDVAKVTVGGLRPDGNAIADIFGKMAELGINVDIIVHDRPAETNGSMRIGFTVGKADLAKVERGLRQLAEERNHPDLTIASESGLAKVSAVGVGMRSYAGVAGRAFKALSAAGIDIHMISTSEIKISCVVSAADADKATRALHAEFVGSTEE